MGDETDAAALFQRSDLVRLEGKVRHSIKTLVGVELPEGWAPASFALPPETVAAGDDIGVAGVEDAGISGDKRRGLKVLAVRVGPASSPRFIAVEKTVDHEDGGSSSPRKDDMDWSDV